MSPYGNVSTAPRFSTCLWEVLKHGAVGTHTAAYGRCMVRFTSSVTGDHV